MMVMVVVMMVIEGLVEVDVGLVRGNDDSDGGSDDGDFDVVMI